MNANTVTTIRRPRPGEHPDWCARGHHCGLGEHRAQPVSLRVDGRGAVVLTRVRVADGREHVEIRTRIALAPGDGPARAHLARILSELETHLRRVVRPAR
jgi:hypothetical protein